MAKKPRGKCALCGRECTLSFEHIPPRSAFNSTPARPVCGMDILTDREKERMPWDTEGLRFENQQKGMGKYSLCESCNNNTGTWYGDAYVTFSHIAHMALKNRTAEDLNGIGFHEIYPLRFIKQILSMFCSINDPELPNLEPIRKFVSDKYAVGLDKTKYKLCMYFTESNLIKHAGLSFVMKTIENKIELMAMSEITAYPFGFILYFDPTENWEYHGTDITICADYDYDFKATIEMPWRIEEMNDFFPESFRSKEEIIKRFEKAAEPSTNPPETESHFPS